MLIIILSKTDGVCMSVFLKGGSKWHGRLLTCSLAAPEKNYYITTILKPICGRHIWSVHSVALVKRPDEQISFKWCTCNNKQRLLETVRNGCWSAFDYLCWYCDDKSSWQMQGMNYSSRQKSSSLFFSVIRSDWNTLRSLLFVIYWNCYLFCFSPNSWMKFGAAFPGCSCSTEPKPKGSALCLVFRVFSLCSWTFALFFELCLFFPWISFPVGSADFRFLTRHDLKVLLDWLLNRISLAFFAFVKSLFCSWPAQVWSAY